MDEKRRRLIPFAIPLLLLLLIGGSFLARIVAKPVFERRRAATLKEASEAAETGRTPAETVTPETTPSAPAPPVRVATPEPPKTLPPTMKVEGKVLFVDGRPAPFAKVDFFVVDLSGNRVRHQATTDANGIFELPCSRHTHAVHTAHVAGAARAVDFEPIFEPEHPGSKCDYVIRLHRETVATGVVNDARGIPVAAATLKFHPFRVSTTNAQEFSMGIYVDPEGETWWKEWVLTDCEATTDPTGAFRAASLWSGIHYVVEVLRGGHDPEFIPVDPPVGSQALRFRLSK